MQEQRFEELLPGRRTTLPQAEHFHERLASNLMRKPGPLMGGSFKLADLQGQMPGYYRRKGKGMSRDVDLLPIFYSMRNAKKVGILHSGEGGLVR